MNDGATHPRQFDGAVQRTLASADLDDDVVVTRGQHSSDALPRHVLVRMSRLDGDLCRTHPLGRRRRENADGTRTDDGDP